MKKNQYLVYVHLHQHSGDIAYAKCYCPAGAGGCCKHVAATLYQLLDYIELGLSDIPDDKSCTQELQKWHVSRKNTTQAALLFEDLIFPQDSYDKDKKGRKRQYQKGRGRTTAQQGRRCQRMTWNGLKLAWKKQEALVIWLVS
ncbi:ATP-dependent DNA helicase PIF1 [Paramuricea clavata]|nr:ATP-dependent DNA helicase PIF1 [Paramuricea clavata]